jgi:two-component system chemotaxis sensor kinase CheA
MSQMNQENTASPNPLMPENANGDLSSSLPSPETAIVDDDADEIGELIKEFLVESYENLDQLDRDLIALEKDPSSKATLASVFRTIHTIKGTCGFFGYNKLESVTHVGENLLSRLRDGKLHLTSEIATTLLKLVDAVRQMLNSIESERREGVVDYSQLIADLTQLLQERQSAEGAEPEVESLTPELSGATAAGEAAPAAITAQPEITPAQQIAASGAPAKPEAPDAAGQSESRGPSVSDNSIRVDVGLLDVLMNLVGELVLARNQILQHTTTQTDSAFNATSQRLNLITTELQGSVMKTRMQPIGNIWSKFPRVVRDLSVACGKKIRVEMEGKETEMDKTIIEAIKDPLTHLVRNSADHGIETPDIRLANGKPAEGLISLRAYHEGGQVNIEISDDGGGVNPEKVKARAVQRGLISSEQAARMSDREAINLIFLPGFSTAEKVTNISGRGVGMDVVKTNIEKIGGNIDVQSKTGQGSTIKIKIPLTLAIIPALIITTSGDRYAIPQVSLLELVRLEGEQARRGIELIYSAPVYRLRGNLLPLIYLNQELKVEESGESDLDRAVNIVVLRADDRQFGLVVDEINDTEEIVVKPLGHKLKGITSFAGATIMGDGKVALILDVMGLAQQADVISEVRDRALTEIATKSQEKTEDQQTLMLFRIGERGRMAIPLSLVARLEEFPAAEVERAGNREVVQYRGQIMPLIRMSHILQYESDYDTNTAPDLMQVVVYSYGHRSIGLVVDQILDIVEESVVLQPFSKRDGVLGSAVIGQRITELLDVPTIIQSIDPTFFEQALAA